MWVVILFCHLIYVIFCIESFTVTIKLYLLFTQCLSLFSTFISGNECEEGLYLTILRDKGEEGLYLTILRDKGKQIGYRNLCTPQLLSLEGRI